MQNRPHPALNATVTGVFLASLLMAAAPVAAQAPVDDGRPNRPDINPAFPGQTEAPEQISGFVAEPMAVVEGLVHPWGIVVLPEDAGYLVTERPGDLRHVARDGTISAPIASVPDVFEVGQGGLLDIALAPDFEQTRVLYLSFAKPIGLTASATAVVRARLSEDLGTLEDVTEIFQQTPYSRIPIHFGSRVHADADGTVWITTGERGGTRSVQMRAQDIEMSYGGVMRITPDGAPAPGNPFTGSDAAPLRYTLGQRNIQGLAQHPVTGAIWTVEHGPAGGDEINLMVPGANYGWPLASYGENYTGTPISDGRTAHTPEFVEPVYYWDPVIAPGGMVFYDAGAQTGRTAMFPEWQGDLLIAGLQASALVRLDMEDGAVVGEERLAQGIGRVRDVALDHDGSVLFLTDYDDGGIFRLIRQ